MKATTANSAWLATSLPAWLRFRRSLQAPEQFQIQTLQKLLQRSADSIYGKAHGFGDIRNYAEFHDRVPIIDYEAMEPWVRRIKVGAQSVFTHEPVTRLLPTSGSSGARKFIPFTDAFQQELNAAIGPWVVDLFQRCPSIAFGPAYWSISPALALSAEKSCVPIGFGDDSAYLGGRRQRFVEALLATPAALGQVEDVETSRYLTLLCLLRRRDLRLVSVWHPSFFTLLLDALPRWWDELLDDIANGGCRRAATLSPAIRRALAASPDSQRAQKVAQSGPADLHALWPKLRIISCWGDAQAAIALAALKQRLPRALIQPKGLIATEALITIPFRGRHPVAVTSHFYEFEDSSGKIRLTHELQRGEIYQVIVTTGAGLWRYRLGDLVEVDGYLGPPLRCDSSGAAAACATYAGKNSLKFSSQCASKARARRSISNLPSPCSRLLLKTKSAGAIPSLSKATYRPS